MCRDACGSPAAFCSLVQPLLQHELTRLLLSPLLPPFDQGDCEKGDPDSSADAAVGSKRFRFASTAATAGADKGCEKRTGATSTDPVWCLCTSAGVKTTEKNCQAGQVRTRRGGRRWGAEIGGGDGGEGEGEGSV